MFGGDREVNNNCTFLKQLLNPSAIMCLKTIPGAKCNSSRSDSVFGFSPWASMTGPAITEGQPKGQQRPGFPSLLLPAWKYKFIVLPNHFFSSFLKGKSKTTKVWCFSFALTTSWESTAIDFAE